MFRTGFDQRPVQNGLQCPVFGKYTPAPAVFALFCFDQFGEAIAPVTFHNFRINYGQIGAGDLTIEEGVFEGFVLGIEQTNGLRFFLRVQAALLAVFPILPKAHAILASEQAVFEFHFVFHSCEANEIEPSSGSPFTQVKVR